MSGMNEGQIEPCGGCGEADPAKRCFNCQHEFFPNRRASATPADVGELVERLRKLADYVDQMQPPLTIREEGDRVIYREAATALERVVRERDEARRRWKEEDREACALRVENGRFKTLMADAAKVLNDTTARAELAEAKLAEARKVIEPFAALEPSKHCHAFMQILVCPEGDTTPGDYSPHIRAARRFLEETK